MGVARTQEARGAAAPAAPTLLSWRDDAGEPQRAQKRARRGEASASTAEPAAAPASPDAHALPPDYRCGTCRPCRLEPHRECAYVELRARAASGHVGATLTARGAASLDAVVSVYWPAELQWFTGRLVAFNPLEPAFLVLYSDGEYHWEALWVSDVRLLPRDASVPRPAALKASAAARLRAAAGRGAVGAHLSLLGQGAVGYLIEVAASPRGGWLRAQVVSYEPRTRLHLLYFLADAGEEWTDLATTPVRAAPDAGVHPRPDSAAEGEAAEVEVAAAALLDDALDALAADEPVRPPLLEDVAALEALDALWAE